MSTKTSPCPFCEKKGLPILPIRYGIAPSQSFGSFKFQSTPPDPTALLGQPEIALEVPETRYTGRSLRGGYLYVYYETHNQWEAFAVGDDGCLSEVPVKDDAPPGGERFHAACARDATKVANASLLTIQDPQTAGIVWVGFSDVWWTRATRDNVEALADAERAKFMRKVDVGSWYNQGNPGGSQPKYAFQIYQVDQMVAEYAMSIADGSLALAYSPFPLHQVHSASTIKQECDTLLESKGLVLWLPDPVGLTMELANYMERRWRVFSEPYGHRMMVDSDLDQLEQVVRRQARDQLVGHVDFKQNAVQSLGDWALTEMASGIRHVFGKDQILLPDNLAPSSVRTYTAAVWQQYADVIDQSARGAFQQEFKAAADTFNQRMMRPLAKAHARWMNSATTRAVFNHHYDPEDINTGVAFTSVYTACTSGTAGYGACLKQYRDWLDEGITDDLSSTNLLWRALIYNNPELASSLKSVSRAMPSASNGAGGDPSQPWAALFASYQAVAGKLRFAGEHHARELQLQGGDVRALMMELGAPLADVIQARGAAGADALATLGMHAGAPARIVTAYGTASDFYRAIFDSLDNLQPMVGKDAPKARMFSLYDRMRIIRAEMQAAGVDMHGKSLRTWAVLLDAGPTDAGVPRSSVEAGAAAATARIKAAAVAPGEHIIPVEDFASRTLRGLKGAGARSGVMLILAAVSWNSAAQAVHAAMAGQKTQAEAMLWSARAGIIGAGFDLVRVGIESGAARPSSMLGPVARMVSKRGLAFVRGFGAGAGAISMLVAFGADARGGISAIADGESGMATLYFMRGSVELLLAGQAGFDLLAIVTSGALEVVIVSGPAVWIALAAIATVSVVVSLVEDPATLTWAKGCSFGKSPEEAYKDNLGREQKDFWQAMTAS